MSEYTQSAAAASARGVCGRSAAASVQRASVAHAVSDGATAFNCSDPTTVGQGIPAGAPEAKRSQSPPEQQELRPS